MCVNEHFILLPDFNQNAINFNPALGFNTGCQMVGMSFQNFDTNMEYYDLFFDGVGSAFALKPESLRFIPVTIPEPTQQDPALSYAKREVSSDYYKFNI